MVDDNDNKDKKKKKDSESNPGDPEVNENKSLTLEEKQKQFEKILNEYLNEKNTNKSHVIEKEDIFKGNGSELELFVSEQLQNQEKIIALGVHVNTNENGNKGRELKQIEEKLVLNNLEAPGSKWYNLDFHNVELSGNFISAGYNVDKEIEKEKNKDPDTERYRTVFNNVKIRNGVIRDADFERIKIRSEGLTLGGEGWKVELINVNLQGIEGIRNLHITPGSVSFKGCKLGAKDVFIEVERPIEKDQVEPIKAMWEPIWQENVASKEVKTTEKYKVAITEIPFVSRDEVFAYLNYKTLHYEARDDYLNKTEFAGKSGNELRQLLTPEEIKIIDAQVKFIENNKKYLLQLQPEIIRQYMLDNSPKQLRNMEGEYPISYVDPEWFNEEKYTKKEIEERIKNLNVEQVDFIVNIDKEEYKVKDLDKYKEAAKAIHDAGVDEDKKANKSKGKFFNFSFRPKDTPSDDTITMSKENCDMKRE